LELRPPETVSPCLVISRVVGFGNPTPKLRPSGPRPSPRAPDGQDPARAVTWGATPASQTWANNVAPYFFFAEILAQGGPYTMLVGWILPVWGAWGGSRARGPQFGGRISKMCPATSAPPPRPYGPGETIPKMTKPSSKMTKLSPKVTKIIPKSDQK